jgi:hypothetical protein
MVQGGFPDVKLAEREGHSSKNPSPWYLLIVTNRGNRPIHFLGASVHASKKGNPWLATYNFAFGKTLTETNRSATLAVPLASMDPATKSIPSNSWPTMAKHIPSLERKRSS